MSSELKARHREAAIAKASGFTQNIEDNIGVEFSTPLLKQLTQQWNITTLETSEVADARAAHDRYRLVNQLTTQLRKLNDVYQNLLKIH